MAKVKVSDTYALVDDADLELVSQYTWWLHNGYARTDKQVNGKRRHIFMHKLILEELPKGMVRDHANGNRLDNRRSNLRVCTQQQNSRNAAGYGPSGFRGVSKYGDKWRAYISLNGKRLYLGLYDDPKEGAEAYNKAALQHFGEFARLN